MAAKKGRKKAAKKRSINVKIGRRHRSKPRKRRSSVGATHHKPAHRKKKRGGGGFLGATSGKLGLKQIAWMAVGVGAGAAITHVILRPVEAKLVTKWPILGKFIGAGEIFLGGFIALKAKKPFMKSLGVGILAGGVDQVFKQVNIYKHIPGMGDMSEIRVPISGPLDDMISGILNSNTRNIYTAQVAGSNYTASVANSAQVEQDFTKVVAGDFENASDSFVKY